jgi:hypothetical protein
MRSDEGFGDRIRVFEEEANWRRTEIKYNVPETF